MPHPAEDRWNLAATFLPQEGSNLDDDSNDSLPCLVVNGVQVYAYFDDGRLHVSVDTADAPAEVCYKSAVPISFRINGFDVHHEGSVDYSLDQLKVDQ